LKELARQCFPNDDVATEIAAREHFDTEEMVAYTTDLDVQVEAQGVLDMAPNSNM
jgi:hypothetical protein